MAERALTACPVKRCKSLEQIRRRFCELGREDDVPLFVSWHIVSLVVVGCRLLWSRSCCQGGLVELEKGSIDLSSEIL